MNKEKTPNPTETKPEQLTDEERKKLKELLENDYSLPKTKEFIKIGLDAKHPVSQDHVQWLREFLIIWKEK